MRPYLLFVSGAGGLAGAALHWEGELPADRRLLVLVVFFLSYGLGQALTDCFQTDTDKISAPYRPLSQGTVTPLSVALVSVVTLLLGGAILVWANVWNLPFALISIIGLASYSFFKRFWYAGPFYNAWIVMLLPVMGFLSLSDGGPEDLFHQSSLFVYVLGLSFFSYSNFVLMGYLKDVSADRATGYQTLPVVFGWDATVWVGDLFAVLAIILAGLCLRDDSGAYLLFGAGALVAVAGQLHAHFNQERTEASAAFPIACTVRSFILWHLALLPGRWDWGIWFALAYYAAFELVLRRRPERGQI
jgi:4-hydroxybenzoate polyprenyltransferase